MRVAVVIVIGVALVAGLADARGQEVENEECPMVECPAGRLCPAVCPPPIVDNEAEGEMGPVAVVEPARWRVALPVVCVYGVYGGCGSN